MANTEVIEKILQTVGEMTIYLLPVYAVLCGLVLVFSLLWLWTMGAIKEITR